MKRVLGLLSFLIALGASLSADALVASENSACEILKAAALRHHFTTQPAPPGFYYCAGWYKVPKYFVIGLHYSFHAPPGWVGSNLVGWYAIRRTDGKIFEYDMATMAVGRPTP